MLNDAQKKRSLEILGKYLTESKKPAEAGSDDMTDDVLDSERLQVIPQIQKLISSFTDKTMSLADFKTENDSLNKKHRLWGFGGMNGQMYFNMLYNCSKAATQLNNSLESVLRKAILVPTDISDAKAKIEALAAFSDSLASHVSSKSKAPRTGSCMFFISYFWQIQNHEKWPVYYRSMVGVLADENIWSPSANYAGDYERFCLLNEELKELFTKVAGRPRSLWDVEHAFWLMKKKPLGPQVTIISSGSGQPETIPDGLPSSLIPPVVSVLPLLARNDPVIEEACKKTGISVEKAFEDRTALLFRMLGYKVEILGQGQGRVPDGIAVSNECRYAIIYDTKARCDGYAMGTDDRAIREYIAQATERLRKNGIKNVYFVVVSSSFRDDFAEIIRSLKIETDIREVLFIEASALLVLLEERLRNPELELGSNGIQGLLARSGIVTVKSMTEYLGS